MEIFLGGQRSKSASREHLVPLRAEMPHKFDSDEVKNECKKTNLESLELRSVTGRSDTADGKDLPPRWTLNAMQAIVLNVPLCGEGENRQAPARSRERPTKMGEKKCIF